MPDQVAGRVVKGTERKRHSASRYLIVAVFAGFLCPFHAEAQPLVDDPWAALAFDEQAFGEVHDLATGQHLNKTVPKRAWRAAADGALRVLPKKAELFPLSAVSKLPQLIDAGLVRKEDASALMRLKCRNGSSVGILFAKTQRRIPKMKSSAEIRVYRKKRRKLRAEMNAAWGGEKFGRGHFSCLMNWLQAQLPKHVPDLPAGATVTQLQQRRYDSWRIAASHFLQAIDPHCNVYPNRLFDAQEKAAARQKPVTAAIVGPKKRRIGVMRVHQFATGTAKQAAAALAQLQKDGRGKLRALVLDMRGNTGGWVSEAERFADLFLGKAVITAVHDRDKAEKRWAKKQKSDFKLPMVVLIDARCRSSCELVTAALHENDRAVVVGSRSFGKATVQGVFEAQEGPWSVFVTIARYHGPRGESLQRYGVTPDIEVAATVTEGRKIWRESRFEHALAPPRKQPPYRSPLVRKKRFDKCYAKVRTCAPGRKNAEDPGQSLCVAREVAHALAGGCRR